MAQGDVVNDVGIDIAADGDVTVQPPSGEYWDIKAASKSTAADSPKNDGVIVGLYDGSEREAVAGAAGSSAAIIGAGAGNLNSIQINNSIYLNFTENFGSSGQVNYSGVQLK